MKLTKLALKLTLALLLATGLGLAQQPTNTLQIAGTATSTGNGTSDAGTQRVAIASNNTAFSVKIQDGAGNALTTNSTTYTAKFALDANLLGTLGTAFSTAGKVDVKSADGDVFVRSNAGSTFPVNATLQTGANTVGKVDILGNAGAIMDFAGQNASSPANALLIGGQFNTTPTTVTSGNVSPFQMSSGGSLLVQCTSGCSASTTISLIPQATSGGMLTKHFVAAASNNATLASTAAAHQFYGVNIFNNASYPVYFKLVDKASSPTCGTDTNVRSFGVQAGTYASFVEPNGLPFANGVAYCLVKGITETDNTAVLISDATVDLEWK